MPKLYALVVIVIAVTAVATADVLLKKASVGSATFMQALEQPAFWMAAALYLLQVVLFTYVFVKRVELGIVGIVQTGLYATIVLASSILLFHEPVTAKKAIGVALTLIGVITLSV